MPHTLLNNRSPGLQHLNQLTPMRDRNHIICRAMQHEDSFPPNIIPDLLQLRCRFMMPPCRDGLQHEAFLREALGVEPLVDLLGSEALVIGLEHPVLALCREHDTWSTRLWHGRSVFANEPGIGEHHARSVGDGAVDGFGNEHVDACTQVLVVRGGVLNGGSCGEEVEGADAFGD